MHKKHRHAVIALSAACALPLSPAFAAEPEDNAGHQQQIGLGAGALLGAIVGGPPGLILGAFGGALIGRDQDNAAQLADRERVLEDDGQRIARLQHDLQAARDRADADLGNARRQQAMLAAVIAKGLSYSVQFRTDSARLEPHYQQDLKRLAEALALLHDLPLRLTVHLTGYADRRGDDGYNHELSQRRVEVVRAYLLHTGLSDVDIARHAIGEEQAVAGQRDTEGLFFDRRVHITVCLTGTPT